MTINPPPPRLPADGHTTASASPTATAASTALPPRFITSTPTCEAISLTEATIPCFPRTGGREAAWVEGDELSCEGVAVNEISNAKQRRTEIVFLIFIGSFRSSYLLSPMPRERRLEFGRGLQPTVAGKFIPVASATIEISRRSRDTEILTDHPVS